MGVETRTSHKKAALGPGVASSRIVGQPSSGATVADDSVDISLEPLHLSSNHDQQNSSDTIVGGEIDPLGVGVRKLVSAMNKLEKLGLPLVKCIVCGDQSAGKSSIIEAISGINVPRASAILNPGQNPMFYVPGSIDEIVSDHCQIEFSPNTVCIYISAPGFPNLLFYELPGIITQVEDRSKGYLIGLVKELVAEYVEDLNALVLLACSLKVGIQVSSAAGMIYKKGVTGRCVS
ncbi:hypothetical protein K469DRAFT_682807 [Zopfia rhizophila CBS 207.26]|uniref:Dynamin-type G domain-containing protein n=1 Tax=Zopfia rhizophila CBS 207.26 TaxID=1314779 RepID=A0A6A6DAF3_9PEZI|nr:hypothetical protein K469DRAFT_682807 [Zopfia rhizophila CBS 207.26]